MTVIPGTTVAWPLSPRIVTIPSTETSITVADLQDTLQDLEDDVDGIIWPQTRNTSGGESLGGGVTVGLTMELQNTQIAFAPRTTSVSSGTATTANSDGSVLIDSAATFITDGVEAGATIINFTDQSVTSIISVDSETQVTHYALADGTENDWDVNDVYKIWNETQCEIAGGNTVAVDNVDAEISAIRPTFGTQVLKTSSSSATTQELEDIQYSSFNGGITIDITSAFSGTEYPTGTPRQPVNNITDALTIANSRGFKTLFIVESMTISSGNFSTGFTFQGASSINTTVTLEANTDVNNCIFTEMTITGVLDNDNRFENCLVQDVTSYDGFMEECGIISSISLGGSSQTTLVDCYAALTSEVPPQIIIGTGSALALRGWEGPLQLTEKDGPEDVSVDMSSGHIYLTPSVNNGSIVVRGVGALTDNSIGAAVDSDNLINKGLLNDITLLAQQIRAEQPSRKEISKAVWRAQLIEFEDDEESAGAMLFNTAETVEDRVVSKDDIAQAVWTKELTDAFGPTTSGGILKKIRLMYKILVS